MDCLLRASDFDATNKNDMRYAAVDDDGGGGDSPQPLSSASPLGSVENEVSWPHLAPSSGGGGTYDEDDDGATSPLGGTN